MSETRTVSRQTIRPTGATALLHRTGFPVITSATGGELAIVTGPSQAGFNPVDLLYASLSACLAMSARIVASEMGAMKEITAIEVSVTGQKATEGLSRVERFDVSFRIAGDIDDDVRRKIAERAEQEVCTVSNTLRGQPEFSLQVSG